MVISKQTASVQGPGRTHRATESSFSFRFLPRGRRAREQLVFLAFLLPATVYIVLFFGYPLYQDITISLQNYGFSAVIAGHGPYVGFANYSAMLKSGVTIRALINTLVFTVASVLFQFVIGFVMAVYLNRKFALSGLLQRLILIPWVMPLVITGTIFSLIFSTSNGLANELLKGVGLIHSPIGWLTSGDLAVLAIIIANIWAGIPFNAILLYSGLQDIPEDQLEAAKVDGANAWQRFFKITVPAMRPVILIVLMLGIVYTAKVFDLVIVLTNGGPDNESQLMSSWAYTQSFGLFNFGTGTAVGNILMIFCLLVGVIYLRVSKSEAGTGAMR